MTDGQWLFEAYAMRKAEQRQVDQRIDQFEALKHMLMALLGLDLVEQAGGTGDEFIPLSIMCGQPDVMQKVLEERNVESGATDALNDSDFDAFSERLARGEDPFADDLVPAPESPQIERRDGPVTISFDED